MLSGQAHYSVLVLPFLTLAAATATRRVSRRIPVPVVGGALFATSVVGYLLGGSGPLAANYAPARVDAHARAAAELSASLPAEASVSATSALVPRLTERARVYVFPAIENADYVFLDLTASSAPTSPGDVYLRARDLLQSGGWAVEHASSGLLLLRRDDTAGPSNVDDVAQLVSRSDQTSSNAFPLSVQDHDPRAQYGDGALRLLDASLVPPVDGAIDVDGPRWTLRTVWLPTRAVSPASRLDFTIQLRDGSTLRRSDIADLWWNPPRLWTPGQPTTVDVPDIPKHLFASWQATFQ
jgi:hypothetical protein